jgi:hypothetical protein
MTLRSLGSKLDGMPIFPPGLPGLPEESAIRVTFPSAEQPVGLKSDKKPVPFNTYTESALGCVSG